MIRTGSLKSKLTEYLSERLRRIEDCNRDIEAKLRADARELDKASNKMDDVNFSEAWKRINLDDRSTFRYVMLIAVCSFVEEALVLIAKKVAKDLYGTEIQGTDQENRARAHLKLLSDHHGLKTAPIKSECETFKYMIILRNCVVHAWGNVEGDRDPEQVRTTVKRLKEYGKAGNFNLVNISKDDYLFLGSNIIVEAILKAERIINHVVQFFQGELKDCGGIGVLLSTKGGAIGKMGFGLCCTDAMTKLIRKDALYETGYTNKSIPSSGHYPDIGLFFPAYGRPSRRTRH